MAKKRNYKYSMIVECEHGLGALIKVLRGFPFEEFQELDSVTNECGVAMVIIDLHARNKETPAQFEYLESCAGVLSYSIERID